MPRPRKAARVNYSKAHGQYRIHDGSARILTGVRDREDTAGAEAALARYLGTKSVEPPKKAGLDEVDCDVILALYLEAKGTSVAGDETLLGCVERLSEFWTGKTPAQINKKTCAEYAEHRAKPRVATIITKTGREIQQSYSAGSQKVRRELGVLVAAINHAHQSGVIRETRKVPLPPAGEAKSRYLRRNELAWLLWASRDTWITLKATGERKRVEDRRHLRRFIITGEETGRRATAILQVRLKMGPGGGYADVANAKIDFRIPNQAETRKRRGQCKMTRRLLCWMRRWKRHGGTYLIEVDGKPISEIDTAFYAACRRAEKMHREWIDRTGSDEKPIDLSDVTPHTLKRTAVTAYFQGNGKLARGEKFFATSARTLSSVYFEHSPEEQDEDAEIMQTGGRRNRPRTTQNGAV
jgi:hypothetical protein